MQQTSAVLSQVTYPQLHQEAGSGWEANEMGPASLQATKARCAGAPIPGSHQDQLFASTDAENGE